MFQQITCSHCGNFFYKVKAWNRFCSRECQKSALKASDRKARELLRAAMKILADTREEAA